MKFCVSCFLTLFAHVAFAAPTLNKVSPSSGFQGATVNLRIAGDGFAAGETEVRFSSPGVLVNRVRVVSSTSLVANVSLLADPGPQEISILGGETSNTLRFDVLPSPLSNPENAVVNQFAGPMSFIGTRDARGTEARFHGPASIWSDGTSLYVADRTANTIRKIAIDTADVSTLVGEPYNTGGVNTFGSGAIWGDGTNLYTAWYCSIRKMVIATGEVTTVAGVNNECALVDGPRDVARLRYNSDFIVGDGSSLYVMNGPVCVSPITGSSCARGPFLPGFIRVISLATGEISSIPYPTAPTGQLQALWPVDGYLYTFWDSPAGSLRIGRINLATNAHEFLFNSQNTSGVPTFIPVGPWFDGNSSFYFVEGRTVRRLVLATGELSSVATLPEAASNKPMGLWGVGDYLYVTDESASIVSRVHLPTQTVSVFAGMYAPPIPGLAGAPFEFTDGLWGDGQNLYVTTRANTIVQVDLATNSARPFASNAASSFSIWGDSTYLYVANSVDSNWTIQRISRSTGEKTTLARGFAFPTGIWGDSTYLYVVDDPVIRRVNKATGEVLTFAGAEGQRGTADGIGGAARFNYPRDIWGDGTYLYVTDYYVGTIRRIRISDAAVTTFAGAAGQTGNVDGIGTDARFAYPYRITGDGTNLYVGNESVARKIVISTGAVTTLMNASADGLWTDGQALYATARGAINRITLATREFSRVMPPLPFSDGVVPSDRFGVAISWNDGEFLYGTSGTAIYKVRIANGEITHVAGAFSESGFVDGVGNHARFSRFTSMWGDGIYLYALQGDSRDAVRRINIATREVSTLAVLPAVQSGAFTYKDIWGTGGYLYISDVLTRSIYRVSIATGEVTRFAGGDHVGGPYEFVDAVGTAARFLSLGPIWGDGSNLYVRDGCTIRKIAIATAEVTTFAGDRNSCADVDGPRSTALLNIVNDIWGNGRVLFVSAPHEIRTINLATGEMKTIAGHPWIIGTEDGNALDARFIVPEGVTSDGESLYVYDTGRIRKISFAVPVQQYSLSTSGADYWSTSNRGSLTIGYARLQAAPGSTTADGVAIYSYRSNGVLVSEASVPASRLVQEGRIYAETGSSVNTGIAIANPNDQSATISFYFTDSDGVSFGSGTVTIAANNQIAAFLNEAPYAGTANARSFTFTSSLPVGAVALRGYVNERAEFLMTTLPVAPISSSSTDAVVLPQFADGGGWRTQVLLVNPTEEPISGTVEIGGTYEYSIARRSSVKIATPGTDPAVHVGSVRVSPAAGSKASVASTVFSYAERGVTVTESGAPSTGIAPSFRLYAEYGAMRTGVAVVNTASTAATVQFELLDLAGSATGYSGSITLDANGHRSLFIDEIPGFQNLPSSFRGVLRVSGNTPISVLGLRGRYNERGDFLISTTPAIADNAATTTEEMIFPHIVSGSGYTTEFLLMSRGAGSEGRMLLRSQSGAELALPIAR